MSVSIVTAYFRQVLVAMSWLEVPLPALLAVQVLQIVVVTSPVLLLLLLLLSAPLLLRLLHVVMVPVSHYLLPANLTTNIFIQARIFLWEVTMKIFPKIQFYKMTNTNDVPVLRPRHTCPPGGPSAAPGRRGRSTAAAGARTGTL